jgi:alpha-tubulin suppressor-like RCC1 family protein
MRIPLRFSLGAFALGVLAASAMIASPGAPASPTESATAIAAGESHTCALTSAGGVKCWGDNFFGQLGDGTNIDRTTAVDVSGLGSGVAAIAAGAGHTCVLTSAGGIKCWGDNFYGQLGDGTTTDRYTPVDVSGLAGRAVSISAGFLHTCALTIAGGVKCWGWNHDGQLGDGTRIDRLTPVDVSGLTSGVAAVSAGGHSCAVLRAGEVKCWGDNSFGQLGDGTTTGRPTPVDVSAITGVVAAASGGYGHTCALTSAGGGKCWGSNRSGQLGDGTTTDRITPVDVSGLGTGVAALALGADHTCALTTTGGVMCWGDNFYGQLGDGTSITRSVLAPASGLTDSIRQITAGYEHTCALTSTGGVKCWGDNRSGQLGDGTSRGRSSPVDVVGFGDVPPPVRCVVPNVLGKPLATAKPRIVRANCRVGRVLRVTSRKKKNTVLGQNPRPGARPKWGARVHLVVSRGR